MSLAIFGITNDGLNLFVNLVILFLVVVWLALVAWTYLDARRRIDDSVLVACATGASLFPYVGTVVYMILRPPEYLEDERERELEIRASQLRVRQLEEQSCPNCEHPIERTFLRCPNCRVRVKDPCESCGKPIDPRWALCPYCETPTRSAPRPEERRPSRTSRASRTSSEAPPQKRPERPARKPSSERSARAAATSADGTDSPSATRPTRRTSASSRSTKAPASKAPASKEPSSASRPSRQQPRADDE
jgi:Double zinc ribbon